MTLTILGNSAGGPFHGRHYTAHFLQVENSYFLIDCGEGTQMQMFQYRTKTERVNQIFITHMHGDHMFGLLGLITNWSLKGRTAPLQIFAPPGLAEWIETTCRVCSVRLPYSIEFVVVDASVSQKVFETLFFFVVFVCCFYVLLSVYLCFDKTLLVLLRFLFFNQNYRFY
jgi:ribonuclease Z